MKIAIAYILYNPNVDLLISSIDSICYQVDSILLVDNGSDKQIDVVRKNVEINQIYLSDNTGIANATNIAITYYRNQGYDYLIISDQDTVYTDNYVSLFKNKVNYINTEKVAAFVPSVYDIISNTVKPFYIKKKIWLKRQVIKEDYKIVYQAMASGMIVQLLCIEIVGLMKTDLFIDYVDFEWCWRIDFYDWKIIALPALSIYHQLGDSTKHLGRKNINLHNTIREYYITRNAAYLALYSPFLRILDKYILFLKALSYLFGFPCLGNNIGKSFKYCLLGFLDAFAKRLGKFNH
jgi:rhamnosyltransferase